jgi:hypothetical protein
MVELGGSAVNNLNDNLLFGLQPGANNNFRSTYTVFGSMPRSNMLDSFPTHRLVTLWPLGASTIFPSKER